ncbi:unnamed protein product [Staurois parvus]|uniref:Uncharacterized protein n=1 Tax=Staurois parvus TaxID=386267 RepID=A0ABN9DGP0_9NEOB|nr:unnamed protein product [Staurois parvus]
MMGHYSSPPLTPVSYLDPVPQRSGPGSAASPSVRPLDVRAAARLRLLTGDWPPEL